MSHSPLPRADYGIDAPGLVRGFIGGGGLAVILGFVLQRFTPFASMLVWSGGSLFVTGCIMVFGSKVRKLHLRDRMLDALHLEGSEHVLDVGCGRGLMLNAAAKRVPRGRAVGIDLWQTQDQSGNHPDVTRANAAAEGVAEKIELETADMRKLPFPDATFDVIVSSWAIHNIPDAEGRKTALDEIIRVTKPDGRLSIADISHGAFYAKHLRARGIADVVLSAPNFLFVIPGRVVTARKPR